MKVIKRNGNVEEYNPDKIKNAISKAFWACGEPLTDEMIQDIMSKIKVPENANVEAIQDQVEQALFKSDNYEVARAYILYREKHKDLRFIKDRSDYIAKCSVSSENTATLSEVDANANVQNKNVATVESEVYKSLNKEIQRYQMKKTLQKMYPEVANMYATDLEHHIIYTHDESSSPVPKPYCVAVSMYPFLLHGTSTLDGVKSEAPKNLTSFCGQINNLLFLLSSQFKGAIAIGEFFNVFYYYCVKEFGEDFWLHEGDVVTFGSKERTISDVIEQAFQNIIYTWNQPAGNRSYQSPFSNISYYDSNYWHSLFDEFTFPDGSKPKWEGVNYLQKKFMRWFNDEREKTLLTFPVESMSLLSNGEEILDQEYFDFTSEMYAKGHSFFTYISDSPDALASCCRLRNELSENTFSFTNGLTGVATGSVNVITLNINRIVQDAYSSYNIGNYDKLTFYQYLQAYLEEILERVYKYHRAYRKQLEDLYENDMLPVYKAGYINLKQQYSTIGINGINEAAEFLGLKCSDNPKYKEFIQLVTSTISDNNRMHSDKNCRFNQEFVPAENLGVKNYDWDKEDGYIVPEDRSCYNSYIYKPDDNSISVLERFRMQGKDYTGKMDGGVALHCNLEDHLSQAQYKGLIEYAINQGVSYFTFNIPNSECKDCGYISKHPLHKCPKCGSKNIEWWTRIIG